MISNLLARHQDNDTARLETFSDGVFAIVITILVLELHVPSTAESVAAGGLFAAILLEWPAYLSFIVSFLLVLVMWISHHRLFGLIQRSDTPLLLLNGLLLLGVTVVPFMAHLVAVHLTDAFQTAAVAVYTGWMVLVAFAYNGLWWYAALGGACSTSARTGPSSATSRASIWSAASCTSSPSP